MEVFPVWRGSNRVDHDPQSGWKRLQNHWDATAGKSTCSQAWPLEFRSWDYEAKGETQLLQAVLWLSHAVAHVCTCKHHKRNCTLISPDYWLIYCARDLHSICGGSDGLTFISCHLEILHSYSTRNLEFFILYRVPEFGVSFRRSVNIVEVTA